MVNQVSSSFPKIGHSATQTKLNNINKHKVKHHRDSYTKTDNRESQQNYVGTVSNELQLCKEFALNCRNEIWTWHSKMYLRYQAEIQCLNT